MTEGLSSPTFGDGAWKGMVSDGQFSSPPLLLCSRTPPPPPPALEPLETVPLCIDTNRIALAFISPPELHPNYCDAGVRKITDLWWLAYLSPLLLRNKSQQQVKLTINTGIDFSGNELAWLLTKI